MGKVSEFITYVIYVIFSISTVVLPTNKSKLELIFFFFFVTIIRT